MHTLFLAVVIIIAQPSQSSSKEQTIESASVAHVEPSFRQLEELQKEFSREDRVIDLNREVQFGRVLLSRPEERQGESYQLPKSVLGLRFYRTF